MGKSDWFEEVGEIWSLLAREILNPVALGERIKETENFFMSLGLNGAVSLEILDASGTFSLRALEMFRMNSFVAFFGS